MYRQLCYYRPDRRSLIVANQGPSDILVSPQIGDVHRITPIGICVRPCHEFRLSYALDGELVWQYWYATCNDSDITVYESIASELDKHATTNVRHSIRDIRVSQMRVDLTSWWAMRRMRCCNRS